MTNSAEAVQLAACPNPWCYSHERDYPLHRLGIAETPIIHGRMGFRVVCDDCGLRGPTVERKGDCYSAWNTRTPSPSPTEQTEAGEYLDRRKLKQALDDLILAARRSWGVGTTEHNLVRDIADLIDKAPILRASHALPDREVVARAAAGILHAELTLDPNRRWDIAGTLADAILSLIQKGRS